MLMDFVTVPIEAIVSIVIDDVDAKRIFQPLTESVECQATKSHAYS